MSRKNTALPADDRSPFSRPRTRAGQKLPFTIRGYRSIIWTRGQVKDFMIRKRGNPNWGRPIPFAPAVATEFEMQVRRLRLTPDAYLVSDELRSWCERNRNRFYVPEWLLHMWDIPVDPDFSNAARKPCPASTLSFSALFKQ